MLYPTTATTAKLWYELDYLQDSSSKTEWNHFYFKRKQLLTVLFMIWAMAMNINSLTILSSLPRSTLFLIVLPRYKHMLHIIWYLDFHEASKMFLFIYLFNINIPLVRHLCPTNCCALQFIQSYSKFL